MSLAELSFKAHVIQLGISLLDIITTFEVASIPARKMICATAMAMTRLSRI